MIKKGMVVSIEYVLTNESGEELDRGDKDDPFQFIQGAEQVIPGLEAGIEGLKTGDKKKLTISPEQGYGEVDDRLKMTVTKDMFPADFPLEVGERFNADLGNGHQGVFTITNIEGKNVHVDGNHPLAGQTLHFDIHVLEVRAATKEEQAHGHVHGPGGHHHH